MLFFFCAMYAPGAYKIGNVYPAFAAKYVGKREPLEYVEWSLLFALQHLKNRFEKLANLFVWLYV